MEFIGDYQIDQVIGRGGMGVVYLASRTQGDVHHQVAIKLMTANRQEATSLRRFSTEQKALSRLSHPYICSFIELGETADGEPYLVMEYVEGVDILDYADQETLTIDERIELWLKVCDAVQSSHRNLVVHRDIKPTNVLVQKDGLPKLLDFGVAKLIEDGIENERTVALENNLTLDYASPERLARGVASTLDDQYALVVLLHELILGKRPFARAGKSLEQLLSDASAKLPSTLVACWDGQTPQQQRESSTRRNSSTRAIRNQLTSDLDPIVRKGLEPDPDQRYATIDALVEDINRYRSQLPVQAKPPRWSYLFARFVRRHATLVSAVAAILVALSAALIYSVGQTQQANEQLHRAEATSAFLRQILEAPSTRWNNELRVGAEASMQEVLEAASLNLHKTSDLSPDIKAQLHISLGEAFLAWSAGPPVIREHRRALRLAQSELAQDHPMQAQARLRLAIALDIQRDADTLHEAERLVREALDWFRTYTPEDYPTIAGALGQSGYNAVLRGDYQSAVEYYTNAADVWYSSGGARVDTFSALGHWLSGDAYFQLGEYQRAEQEWLTSIDILKQLTGQPIPEWYYPLYGTLRLAIYRGDGKQIRERIAEIMAFVPRADPNHIAVHTLMTWVVLGHVLTGELGLAGDLLDELDAKQATMPEETEYFNALQGTRAIWLVAVGRNRDALAIFQALATLYPSYNKVQKFLYDLNRGEALLALGKVEDAKVAVQKARAGIPEAIADHSILATKLAALLHKLTQQ